MRIDIFCESGKKIGLGHFYRCIKLISLCMKNKQVSVITLHNRGDFIPPPLSSLLGKSNIHSPLIECKNYEWLSILQPEILDLTIIDSYEAQEGFYHQLYHQSKALICFDDMLRDIYPPQSYILNSAPQAKQYFLQKPYNLWCGKEYILPPLAEAIQANISQGSSNNVFITFGGADTQNLTQSFLHELSLLAQSQTNLISYHFHIVLGNAYTHELQIPSNLKVFDISIYNALPPHEFIAKARECAYAISAGGGTMLELLMLKIPSIIIESASNQHLYIQQWVKEGVIAQAHTPKEALSIFLSWHTKTPTQANNTLHKIQAKLSGLSLGTLLPQSLSHLIEQIAIQTTSNKIEAISFKDLTQEETRLVLSMRNHPKIACWMYSNHITQNSHNAFIEVLKTDKTKQYWLLKESGEYIGVGSLTRINPVHKHAFLGIYANPLSHKTHKGKNILQFLEEFARVHLNLHTLHLEVLKHNFHALSFYEKYGYIHEGILHDFIFSKGRYYDVILMYKELK